MTQASKHTNAIHQLYPVGHRIDQTIVVTTNTEMQKRRFTLQHPAVLKTKQEV